MRPLRCAAAGYFATTALCCALACSLDYSVGPFDGGDSGNPSPDGGKPSDGGGSDGPATAVPPSCATAQTCTGGKSCCASDLVTGGPFHRDNDGNYAATISDFQLDVFEVTVGRFRAFVNAGKGTRNSAPAAGAGAHPKVANSGWDPSWNGNLAASTDALKTALACDPSMETWTASPSAQETRPINCVTWYDAFAFCIWDGGRIPTTSEWNYAAAGGSKQLAYPWGNAFESSRVTYGCGGSCSKDNLLPVGSKSPQGDGTWNQADLAGSLWEWTLDSSRTLLPPPCADCSNYSPSATPRVRRGGNVSSENTDELRTDYSSERPGTERHWSNGFRCARPAK
ncbi:formylglycine-generating enzyme family protein [Pendulispora brunnea]|uniref:Formylglycine-generating enzyme family protein n=1 Tax=Pendulispora brunnea TaxID=2905690 RepID=A0ABZ2K260_9BACT